MEQLRRNIETPNSPDPPAETEVTWDPAARPDI